MQYFDFRNDHLSNTEGNNHIKDKPNRSNESKYAMGQKNFNCHDFKINVNSKVKALKDDQLVPQKQSTTSSVANSSKQYSSKDARYLSYSQYQTPNLIDKISGKKYLPGDIRHQSNSNNAISQKNNEGYLPGDTRYQSNSQNVNTNDQTNIRRYLPGDIRYQPNQETNLNEKSELKKIRRNLPGDIRNLQKEKGFVGTKSSSGKRYLPGEIKYQLNLFLFNSVFFFHYRR